VIPAAYGANPAKSVTRELYGGWDRNYANTGPYVQHASYYDTPETTQ
jgi:hypothetical protein